MTASVAATRPGLTTAGSAGTAMAGNQTAGTETAEAGPAGADFLARAAADVDRRIVAYLPAREPWDHLYRPIADYPLRSGGRRFRPALLLASCEALGGQRAAALDAAVGVELLHNAFLIHDDIEDGSELRRGEPTLQRIYGDELAINAGDGLMVIALRALTTQPGWVDPRISRSVAGEASLLCQISVEGQAMELGWRRDNAVDLTVRDYIEMAAKKTAWYTVVAPLRIGAICAGASAAFVDRLVAFGVFAGVAFQIQDDIANLALDDASGGKERFGDLWEGKRTPMLIELQRRLAGRDGERLYGIYAKSRRERTADEVAWVFAAMQACGVIDHARAVACGFAGAALGAFEHAFTDVADSPALRFLAGFGQRILDQAS